MRRSVSLRLDRDDLRMHHLGLLRRVEVFDVVDEAALVDEGIAAAVAAVILGALVREGDAQTLVEEGHLLESGAEGVVVELDGLEDVVVRPEGDGRAGLGRLLALLERRIRHTVLEALAPDVALPTHLDLEGVGERVDDRAADAVQATGDGVSAATEFSARVEDCQDDLDGRLLLDRVDVDRGCHGRCRPP
jgi:hypothetical protein